MNWTPENPANAGEDSPIHLAKTFLYEDNYY